MKIVNGSAIVTGGASGLGLATARRLVAEGADVVVVDLESSDGIATAASIGAIFVAADVTDPEAVATAVRVAGDRAPLRAVVHCAGRGGPMRVVDKTGAPGSYQLFAEIIRVNLVGSPPGGRVEPAPAAQPRPHPHQRVWAIV